MFYYVDHSSELIRTHDGRCKRRLSWRYATHVQRRASVCEPCSPGLEQHSVIVAWFVHSGERTVLLDGVPVAGVGASGPKGSSVLDVCWNIDDLQYPGRNATFRVVAVTSKPNGSPDGFRCHDLLIDGTSLLGYPMAPGANRFLADNEDFENEAESGAGSIVDILYPDGVPELNVSSQLSSPSWDFSPIQQSNSRGECDVRQEVSMSSPNSPYWKEKIKMVTSIDTCDSIRTWVNDVA
mmetsp:Transcript_33044/g.98311  ORF Transcript_33044/g.98311 Transcript_33044/m.98311 type:complete len:238 (-) Transcript_33044:668-1381(-)